MFFPNWRAPNEAATLEIFSVTLDHCADPAAPKISLAPLNDASPRGALAGQGASSGCKSLGSIRKRNMKSLQCQDVRGVVVLLAFFVARKFQGAATASILAWQRRLWPALIRQPCPSRSSWDISNLVTRQHSSPSTLRTELTPSWRLFNPFTRVGRLLLSAQFYAPPRSLTIVVLFGKRGRHSSQQSVVMSEPSKDHCSLLLPRCIPYSPPPGRKSKHGSSSEKGWASSFFTFYRATSGWSTTRSRDRPTSQGNLFVASSYFILYTHPPGHPWMSTFTVHRKIR